ncbi:MAG: acylphosphatase [Gammaproteobacteria bacterium]|jgi:acylphosphatase|nr:acylphosphatase [Gammaproteobacteria bacterium]
MHSVKGYVSGRVQGVGFRYFVRTAAQQNGLCGYAYNHADGRVEFLLQGKAEAVERVIEMIRSGPQHARVGAVSLDAPQDLAACQGFATR